jgi:hypothetical protein
MEENECIKVKSSQRYRRRNFEDLWSAYVNLAEAQIFDEILVVGCLRIKNCRFLHQLCSWFRVWRFWC